MKGETIVSHDQHVIHINDELSFSEFFFKYCVHHHLEGGWGVSQAEEHDSWFKEAFIGNESRLPFVSSPDANIVIAPSYVKFSEQCSGSSFIDELRNEWEGVSISDSPLV